MKIAVTYQNGMVFQHFGHCENFKVYTVDGGTVVASEVINATGSGHGALAGFLSSMAIDTLLCGGIGAGARTALTQAGIQFYPGVTGSADQSVDALLAGTLLYDLNTVCNHHHEDGHDCGDHAHGDHVCGENKHGCAGH